MIDQAYTITGERSSDLESVLEGLKNLQSEEGVEQKDVFLPDEDDLEDGSPTTNKMKLKNYDAVLKAPPPPEEACTPTAQSGSLRSLSSDTW